jgi:hypothetical protein
VKQWNVFVLIFLSFLFLTACQKEEDYIYFMQHPDALQKATAACRVKNLSYCDDVNKAGEDFSALVKERAEDPEKFGQKIMQEQEKLINFLQMYRQTKQLGDESKIKLAAKIYDDEKVKIHVLYAVIRATSQITRSKE